MRDTLNLVYTSDTVTGNTRHSPESRQRAEIMARIHRAPKPKAPDAHDVAMIQALLAPVYTDEPMIFLDHEGLPYCTHEATPHAPHSRDLTGCPTVHCAG